MRASEWQFLCAVHEQPKSCCAIDYCCHTLDWAANVVTDPKLFPSRIVVLSDAQNKGVAVRNLVNVSRRLHRIFAHAWFQHRGVFWGLESQTGLYVFFKTVCDMYDLLPAENYKLPPEAEGLETNTAVPPEGHADKKQLPATAPISIAKPPAARDGSGATNPAEDENFQLVGRTNTRRHIRSSPSTGSAVTTVMEADEEDHGDVTSKLKELHISAPETVEEEAEVAEVPVIVEHAIMDQPPQMSPGPKEPETKAPDETEPETPRPGGEPTSKGDDGDSTSKDAEESVPLPPPSPKHMPKEEEQEKNSLKDTKPPAEDEGETGDLEESKETTDVESNPTGLSSTGTHDWADEAKSDPPIDTPQGSDDEVEKDTEKDDEKKHEVKKDVPEKE
jgi:hypothetical protein